MIRSRIRSLPLSWEIIYYAVIVIIFGTGIWLRVQLPSVPFIENDSWDYLTPIFNRLGQNTFSSTFREFLYPFLLGCMFWTYPNFTTIIVVQHIAGFLTAIILIITWHRMRVFLPEEKFVDILHRCGGCVLTAAYFLPNVTIFLEHAIRPEIFFQLSGALCLFLATEFSRKTFRTYYFGVRAGVLGIFLIFFSLVAYYLRPYFGFGIVCALLPVIIAIIKIPGKWVTKCSSVVFGLLLVYVLLVTPDKRFHSITKNTSRAKNASYLAQTLFASSGDVIYDLLQKDVRALSVEDQNRPILESLLRSMDQISYSPRIVYGFTRLYPDDVLYRGPIDNLRQHLHGDEKRMKDFCYHYYFRAWETHPFRMIKKVIVHLWYFYCPIGGRVFECGGKVITPVRIQKNVESLQNEYSLSYGWPPYQDYMRRSIALQQTTLQAVKIPIFMKILGICMNALYSFSLVLTLFFTVALHSGWLKNEAKSTSFKRASIWACYLFSYNFGISLTIAVVHEMPQYRYHFGQTLFSALSECFALVFLAAMIAFIRQRRIHGKVSEPI